MAKSTRKTASYEYVTIAELAVQLGVSPSTIEVWIRDGRLPEPNPLIARHWPKSAIENLPPLPLRRRGPAPGTRYAKRGRS